jgi:hypothetical protein
LYLIFAAVVKGCVVVKGGVVAKVKLGFPIKADALSVLPNFMNFLGFTIFIKSYALVLLINPIGRYI